MLLVLRNCALCSRKFETVKLRTTVWEFKKSIVTQLYVKLISARFGSKKWLFLQFQRHAILNFGTFATQKIAEIYYYTKSELLKLPKMTIFDRLKPTEI